jgi:ATP-dependent RNA helicase DDX51/DBP6
MDLFHMRRYTGDDGGETVDDVAEVSAHKGQAEILAELKNRIEKKRKKKEEEASEDAVADKKPKLDGGKDVAEEKIEQDGQEDKKGKKKRKRKKKGVDADDEDPSATGFTVLGEKMDRSKSKVRRVLPAWLANPDVVSVDYSEDQMPVEKLAGLDSKSVADLKANGIANFFPVQRQVIPRLLPPKKGDLFRPSDVCVSAPTGSGKTLAFVLPIVQALRNRVVTRIRALVILPVQDLATQVYRVFQIYAADSGLKVKLLTPQRSFAQEQNELVRRGIVGDLHSLTDIIVTTPGRLVDHIQNTEGFSLEHLRYLVIDEADRVMEDIQNDWLTHVESAVYTGSRNRPGPLTVENASKGELPLQKLLFSATLSQNPEQLEQLNLFEPKLFTSVVKPKDILQEPVKEGEGDNFEFIGQYTTPAELSESMVVCKDSLKKPQILHHLLVTKQMKKVLVFTKSLEHTHFLALLLKEYGLSVAELSSQVNFAPFLFKLIINC